MNKQIVREKLLTFLKDKLEQLNISRDEITDDFNLLNSGLIDSLDLLNLITFIEKDFNIQLRFEGNISDNFIMSILTENILKRYALKN